MSVLAIVPARGGSKGIPKKNLALLGGRPLVAHAIASGRGCPHVGRVLVTTDDPEIRRVAIEHGAEAPFLRPADLAADATPDLPVFVHALRWLDEHEGYRSDAVLHLRPTTPLRRQRHVDAAVELLLKHPEADSVRGVSVPFQNPFKMWRRDSGPYLSPLLAAGVPEPYNQPRQNLPEVLWQSGYVDVAWTRTLTEKRSMTGDRILPYVLDDRLIVDIDDPFSLELGEFLLARDRY